MSVTSSSHHYTKEKIASEEEQIRAAQKDPRAFAPLYESYYLRIFKYVFQRTGNEDATADITSTVFAKAINNLPKYEFRGVPFSAWLFRVAQNELNQAFRKNKAQRSVQIQSEQLEALVEETDERYSDTLRTQLVEALRELNPEELALIELRFFEKRSFREIGEIVDLTENNAKVKTFRVVKKLKRLLTSEKNGLWKRQR